MKIDKLSPDRYVVAVSGGVDSIVLLDLLTKQPQLDLIVAHFDHGIRSDSKKDRLFVQDIVRGQKLKFEYGEGRLGRSASEARARQARYHFLDSIKEKYNAKSIVTAHHQDDILETAIINMIRGTGRLGLSSLKNTPRLTRPLLRARKQAIINYANVNGLSWNEDSTNTDSSYLRNYIRHNLLSKISEEDRNKLLNLTEQSSIFNRKLDKILTSQLLKNTHSRQLNRLWFIMLPHSVSKEIIATWLRQQGLNAFDHKTIERLVVSAKTAQNNSRVNIYSNKVLEIHKKHLALGTLDR